MFLSVLARTDHFVFYSVALHWDVLCFMRGDANNFVYKREPLKNPDFWNSASFLALNAKPGFQALFSL